MPDLACSRKMLKKRDLSNACPQGGSEPVQGLKRGLVRGGGETEAAGEPVILAQGPAGTSTTPSDAALLAERRASRKASYSAGATSDTFRLPEPAKP